MSFSHSSGVITQTGTDTDLSGLSGLTGVTVVNESQTIYELDAVRIVIDGTLSYNAANERIVFKNPPTGGVNLILTSSTGSWTTTSSLYGEDRPDYIAVDFGDNEAGFSATTPYLIVVDPSGVIDLQGTYISNNSSATSGRIIDIDGSATFSNGKWVNYTGTQLSHQIAGSGTVDCNNFTWQNVTGNAVSTSTFINTWTDYKFIDFQEAFVVYSLSSTASVSNESAIVTTGLDYDNVNSNIFRVRTKGVNNAVIDVTNVLGGSSVVATGSKDAAGPGNPYLVIRQKVNFTFLDENGSPSTCVVYGKDVDNGSRIANFSVAGVSYNFSADQEYTNTGTSATFTILTQVRETSLVRTSSIWDTVDNRGSSDGAIIPFSVIAYDRELTIPIDYVQGNVDSDVTVIMLPDLLITESTKATVDAYIGYETAQKSYDGAKAILVDNYITQEGPQNRYIGRIGSQIDLDGGSATNVIYDSTTTPKIDYTGTTLTFDHASDYTGGCTGTGTFTLLGSLSLNGGTFDNSGGILIDNSSDGKTFTDVTANKITHSGTGSRTLSLDGGSVTEIEVTGGADLAVNLLNGATVTTETETSGTISITRDIVTITNLDAYTLHIEDNLGVQQHYDASITGSYTFNGPNSSTGTWSVVVDKQGCQRRTITFDADAPTDTIDGTLIENLDFSGNPVYTGTTSATVTIVGVEGANKVDVGDGTITGQIIYNMVQDYNITSAGMQNSDFTVDFLPTSNGNYLALGSAVQLRRRSAGDNNAKVDAITSHPSDTPVDGTNGPVAIEAAANKLTAQEVRDAMALALTGSVTIESDSIDDKIANSGGGLDEGELHTALDNYSNKDSYKADVSAIETKAQADVRQLSLTTQHSQTQSDIAALPTPLTAAEVNSEVDAALIDYDSPTNAELTAAFTEIKGVGWSTETLKDIRGNGGSGASLSEIEGSAIIAKQATSNSILAQTTDILVDTNELQTNQGDWNTATGFATPTDVTNSQSAIIAQVDVNEAKIDALETKTQADARQVILIADHSSTQSAIAALPQDKTGYTLTSADHTSIATAVEAAILNELDGQVVIDAIVQAIGNTNIDQPKLVAAIVAAMDLENNIHTALDSYVNKEDYTDDFEETAQDLADKIVATYNATNP